MERNRTEPSRMKKCCTVDNLEQSSSDGTLSACINVLVCKTCDHQESYAYRERNEQNALFSYCQFAAKRTMLGLPLFSRRKEETNV